jgi:glycosyltransferase involved in cell wall biosynthesis
LRFWRFLQTQRVAIVHLHYGGRFVRWLVRRATGAKTIVHIHALPEHAGRPACVRITGVDLVVADSSAAANRVRGARTRVVYAGTAAADDESKAVASIAGQPVIIGVACRLVPVKGIADLLRAAAILRREGADIRVEIAGDGIERARLENLAGRLGIADVVSFLGWRDDLPMVMKRWHLFAQPSLRECFGISILEAMAAGLPILATAVGGIPELVENGSSGLLVAPKDPVGLADGLRALVLDPALRRRMGDAGHSRAHAEFSMGRMVSEMTDVYDSLVNSHDSANARGSVR